MVFIGFDPGNLDKLVKSQKTPVIAGMTSSETFCKSIQNLVIIP